jgi:hypothetical protein
MEIGREQQQQQQEDEEEIEERDAIKIRSIVL